MNRGWSAGAQAFPMAPVFVEGLGAPGTSRALDALRRIESAPPVEPPKPASPSPSASPIAAADFSAALGRHAAEAARILRVDRVAVWQFSGPQAGVRCLVRYHRREGTLATPGLSGVATANGFRQVFEGGATLTVEDATRDRPEIEPIRPWIVTEGIRALLALPIHLRGRLNGFVTFEEDRGPRRWTSHARELANALASQMAETLAGGEDGPRSVSVQEADDLGPTAVTTSEVAPEVPSDEPLPPEIPEPPFPKTPAEPVSAQEPAVGIAPAPEALSEEPQAPETRAEPAQAPEAPVREVPAPRQPSNSLHPAGPVQDRGGRRRLSQAEAAALLAAETFPELIEMLDVHRGYLELLADTLEDRLEDVAIILGAKAASHRVETGLEDFLHHLNAGIGTHLPLELNQLLSGMIATLAREAGDRVRLRVAPSADTIPIEGDAALLERALVHLVRSARQEAPAGSDIRVSWGRVYASRGGEAGGEVSEAGLARIRVEDRGDGGPGDVGSRILEPCDPHAAGEPSPGREGFRRGLEISAVRAIVEGHGGWIEGRSDPGTGTVLDLYLPLARDPALAAPAPKTTDADSERAAEIAPGKVALPPSILIIEDEPLLARLLDQVLSRQRFRTEVVAGATEADRRWRQAHSAGGFDLVVVEKVLAGGRSGLDLVTRWRSEAPKLGVVMLDRRAHGQEETSAGKDEIPILRRPFDPSDVLTRVREELARAADVSAERDSGSEPSASGLSGSVLAH
ncbi:MAG: GAF domain-containing protein [Gemmatimonadota bacterium]